MTTTRGHGPDDFDPTRSLPNAAYRSQVWHDAELAHIWHNDWVFATTEDALANPGDQVPITIGRQPVVLLRDQDGDLVALANLCTHRGTLLVDQATNAKRIQCPYHAWTFADSGRLLSVPFSPKHEIDKSQHCLPTYRVESWHGLVFVSLNADVEPLSVRFAATDGVVAESVLDTLHHWSAQQTIETWECNWKLAMLNAMESYHLFQVHPDTLEPYTPTKDSYYVAGSARATVTASPGTDGSLSHVLSLPPGFVGVLSDDAFVWIAVEPDGFERCTIRTGGAFTSPPPAPDAGRLNKWMHQAASAAYQTAMPNFLPEDKAICERGQRGAIGDFAPGPLLEVERVVQDFGSYLAWCLQGAETGVVLRRPPASEARLTQ